MEIPHLEKGMRVYVRGLDIAGEAEFVSATAAIVQCDDGVRRLYFRHELGVHAGSGSV